MALPNKESGLVDPGSVNTNRVTDPSMGAPGGSGSVVQQPISVVGGNTGAPNNSVTPGNGSKVIGQAQGGGSDFTTPTTAHVNGPVSSASPMPWDTPTPAANPTTPSAQATAGQATAGLIGPVSTLDPNAMSNAVNRVTDPNSAISQRATAIANEQSNASGLLNSSMAVGAARNAVLNAALPIAQGDVGAQSQNAQQTNAVNTAQAQMDTGVNTSNAQQKTAVSTTNAAAQNAQIMSQLDQSNKLQLAGINAKYQNALASNQNASNLYSQYMKQIGDIQNNPNMDAATKSAGIAALVSQLQGGMSNMSAVSGLDLGSGLDFSNMQSTANTTAADAQAKKDAAAVAAGNATADQKARDDARKKKDKENILATGGGSIPSLLFPNGPQLPAPPTPPSLGSVGGHSLDPRDW